MLRFFLLSICFLCSVHLVSDAFFLPEERLLDQSSMVEEALCVDLYKKMNLEGLVDLTAFKQAVHGYRRIQGRQRDILTLIDFSKPSTQNRLYVFDMNHKKLLFSSLVAHGRNSGDLYATSFSNKPGSYQSSLGFYLTGSTYHGSNGYSLLLDGLEKGLNDFARERAIVIHGADYANPSVIAYGGRLGRSLGCPALPRHLSRPIIDAIKDGSVLFIYASKREYLAQSAFF
ncbi:hypothetical protein, secreted [gut metagenome]|uniref:Murein L,D-transpeptidase catalytic domain family protein n=1 Tax=gut metagenome TaxID=749906 RepID=J9GNX5_9ZZZZ